MGRIKARESCFKLLFEYEFIKQKNEITLEEFLSEKDIDDSDKEYINSVYNGVIEKDNELNEIISSHLVKYILDRIFKIDLAILKLSIYEIKYLCQTPAVIINEAVKLSKKYSTDNGYKFVNGVLANIIKGE